MPVVEFVVLVAVLAVAGTFCVWVGHRWGMSEALTDHSACRRREGDERRRAEAAESYAAELERESGWNGMRVRGLERQLADLGVEPFLSDEDVPGGDVTRG